MGDLLSSDSGGNGPLDRLPVTLSPGGIWACALAETALLWIAGLMAKFVLYSARDRCLPRVGRQTLRNHGTLVCCVLPGRHFDLPELLQALVNPQSRFRCRLAWVSRAARRIFQRVKSASLSTFTSSPSPPGPPRFSACLSNLGLGFAGRRFALWLQANS